MSQHDFDIANQTASNARADINLALKALASNNSGAAEPSTTYANMWWYEDDTNTLKIRNEANNAWITFSVLDQSNNRVESFTADSFNTGSDLGLKNSVTTFPNALETVNNLRGVSFNWNKNNKPSVGVIAQELEKIVPELVNDNEDGYKSVTYMGLIGVLIEAVKELSEQVEELKAR